MDILGLTFAGIIYGAEFTQESKHYNNKRVREYFVTVTPVISNGWLDIKPTLAVGAYEGYKVYDGTSTKSASVRPGIELKVKSPYWLYVKGAYEWRPQADEQWFFGGIGIDVPLGNFKLGLEYGRWMNKVESREIRLTSWFSSTIPEHNYYGSYIKVKVGYKNISVYYQYNQSDNQVKQYEVLWWTVSSKQPSQMRWGVEIAF